MSIYSKLYDWQKNIVNKFIDKQSFGIWLDMGLGKTPVSLAFAEQHNCTKILVITINAKALENEYISGSWFNWDKSNAIKHNFRNKWQTEFSQSENDMLLVNYESLFERGKNRRERVTIKQNIQNFIESCKAHNVAIIVDESHKMKDLQSQQSLAIFKIEKELKRFAKNVYSYLLTGTPFTTGYVDLYAQLKFLGCPMNKGEFVDDFCVRGQVPGLLGWQQPIVGYKNLDKLYKVIHNYAITIKSEDVADLPEKIFIYHSSKWSKDFTMFTQEFAKPKDIIATFERHNIVDYDDIYSCCGDKKINNPFFRNIDFPDYKWLAETSGTNWLRARQLSIGFNGNANEAIWYDRRRLNDIKTFLENCPDNYLLFYNFTPELLELYDICEELGYNIDVYCGEAKSTVFYDRYSKLSEAEKLTNKKNIILANFASGSTGLNWQAYNKVIVASIPLFSEWDQALKRVHRLGQKFNCIYHIFYQNNWLDNGMINALNEKTEYSVNMYKSDLERVNKIMEENEDD